MWSGDAISTGLAATYLFEHRKVSNYSLLGHISHFLLLIVWFEERMHDKQFQKIQGPLYVHVNQGSLLEIFAKEMVLVCPVVEDAPGLHQLQSVSTIGAC